MAPDLSPAPTAAGSLAEPALRWSSEATTIPAIQRDLRALWSGRDLTMEVDGVRSRHVAARSSVMNLVVVAADRPAAARAADTIARLAGRHPSRTLIVVPVEPGGEVALRARLEARCILPRADAPETCTELIQLEVSGSAGRHLEAVVTPLLVPDLPVTAWWPAEPDFESEATEAILALSDRLVVDASSWSGTGIARLRAMAARASAGGLAVSDFALVRQSRWREAIASVFDLPDLLPYLHSLRRIAVTYAVPDAAFPLEAVNVVKPVYHVAWLASRLGLAVAQPLASREIRHPTASGGTAMGRIRAALLRGPAGEVHVSIGPTDSTLPSGTTLQVELLAERRGSELRATITADAESITVHGWLDGQAVVERSFLAPRRTEVDLLEEAIELGARDRIAADTLRFAAALSAPTVDEPTDPARGAP